MANLAETILWGTSLLFIALFIYSILILENKGLTRIRFRIELVIFILLLLSIFVFILFCSFNDAPFFKAIDPVDFGYSPFSWKHFPTIATFLSLQLIALWMIWLKGSNLPPLSLVIFLSLIMIGIVINFNLILHLFHVNDEGNESSYRSLTFVPMIYPILVLLISIALIVKVMREKRKIAADITYKNGVLARMNNVLNARLGKSLGMMILLFPVFLVITMILVLFGQESDSMLKVFRETTTWGYSQMTHPPYLDHQGHYLCTVAACGNPSIVKPIRIGNRHGNEIIVNRQLMIANAYEEMLSDYSPKFHRFVRKVYDNYGYGFSKNINTVKKSNVVYLLMKPVEWLFLLNLYLLCNRPEQKINKQYSN
jgi:hypothetical protein